MAGGALIRALPKRWDLAVAIGFGVALFAVRPYTLLNPYSAPLALAAIYGAMYAVSIGPSVPRTVEASMRLSRALLLGFAAIAVARIVIRTHIPPDSRPIAIGLALAAAVAEEAYFRRVLYGVVEGDVPPGGSVRTGIAIVASASVFALIHYPDYGAAALPLDFGAGLLFAWQRWATGSWVTPAATHAFANLLASV